MSRRVSNRTPAESRDQPSLPAQFPVEVAPAPDNGADVGADAELLRHGVEGQVDAWEELYRKCHPPLLRSMISDTG